MRRRAPAINLQLAAVRHLHVHYLHTPGSVGRYTGMLRGLPFSFSAHAKDIWTTPAWEKRAKLDEALWTVYSGDLVGFVQGIPLALFMLAAGVVSRDTGVFPRWTGLVALGTVPLLVLGVGSVAGREVDGGPLVLPLMLGYLGTLVWTVAICVVLLRSASARADLVASAA